MGEAIIENASGEFASLVTKAEFEERLRERDRRYARERWQLLGLMVTIIGGVIFGADQWFSSKLEPFRVGLKNIEQHGQRLEDMLEKAREESREDFQALLLERNERRD